MPGTAKNLDSTKITTGPGYLWTGVAIPAAGARITLHTDGTPESVANPSARNIGLTKAGNKIVLKFAQSAQEADELTTPYRNIITSDNASLEGEMLQLEDFTTLKALVPNGTYGSAAGYEQITFGGITAIPAIAKPCVALIWALTVDPTKFGVFQLYQAINTNGVEATITRKSDASTAYKLEGQSISSRAAGDQTGNLWRQA